VVAFAEHVLGNAAQLWLESSLDQKQRLHKALFPHGMTYSEDGVFGTSESSMIFRLLQSLPAEKASEASLTVPSWNQILQALRELDLLRQQAAA